MSSLSIDLDALNEPQRQAVLCTDGPLLVLAGAGSGKTRVLTQRIAHMICDLGVPAWQILAITFTNKAAREMRERLEQLMEGVSLRGMWVCTFHAMCVRMLRFDAERLGYSSNFSIYDDDDSKRLLKNIFESLGINAKTFPVNMVAARISQAKNELVSADEFARSASGARDQVVARVYSELQRRLRQANAMDFDDLLVNAFSLLEQNTDILAAYQDRFRYISVDEYQDTNYAQYRICRLLASRHGNLMVVGDDDQSIYSWRGADIRNILTFMSDNPGARQIKLEQNYRSTGHILAAANAVVAHNAQRSPKRLFTDAGDGEKIRLYQASDERDEGRWIAAQMAALHERGARYGDMALFYRTNAQSRILEDMLLRAGVPYIIVGGTRFFDRAEIRDLMAYLKLVVNPNDDVSALRVINKPARGIGATTQQTISALAAQYNVPFLQAVEIALVEERSLGSRAQNALVRFLQLVQEMRSYRGDLVDVVKMITSKTGLIEALENEESVEADGRIENIREFINVVQDYVHAHEPAADLLSNAQVQALCAGPGAFLASGSDAGLGAGLGGSLGAGPGAFPGEAAEADSASGPDPAARQEATPGQDSATDPLDLVSFMEWLALRTDLDTASETGSSATLMTIHAAKGLEFDNVFVAGMEESLFPSRSRDLSEDHMEEERRLAYVAITRARRRLYLTYAMSRHQWGETVSNPPSRFLREIPQDHYEMAGVGSRGFSGMGWEKRGDRHGTFGSGRGSEMYGGRVFGSATRSSGGSAAVSAPERTFGSGTARRTAGRQLASGQTSPAGTTRPAARYDAAAASAAFACGDRVNHKVFGTGTVLSAKGDVIQVRFDTGSVKKLLKGYAPIVKIG